MSTIKVTEPTVSIGSTGWKLESTVSGAKGTTVRTGFTVGMTQMTVNDALAMDGGAASFSITLPPLSGAPTVVAWAAETGAPDATPPVSASTRLSDDGTPPVQIPDPRDLVWSKPFAWFTGLVLLALVGALCAGVAVVWDKRIGHPAAPSRVVEMVVFLGACLGAAAVLVGAWIVVLEMRGRAPRKPETTANAVSVRTAVNGDVGDIVDSLSKFRGPLLLVVVGALLVAAMALVGRDVARDQLPSVPATTTTVP